MMDKNMKKNVYVTESLHCTAEISRRLEINYTSVKYTKKSYAVKNQDQSNVPMFHS